MTVSYTHIMCIDHDHFLFSSSPLLPFSSSPGPFPVLNCPWSFFIFVFVLVSTYDRKDAMLVFLCMAYLLEHNVLIFLSNDRISFFSMAE